MSSKSTVANTTITPRQFFESEAIQQHMTKILGDKSKSFATTVLSIINNTAALQKCDPASIYQCALVATTLDLPLNQNLGYAYLIPYGNKAQFQIGYKGFIQLAQRSGRFLKINAVPTFENDTEELVFKRLNSLLPTNGEGELTGYVAYFKLLNGYEHSLAMSKEDLLSHGKKYSQSFKGGFGLWKDDFEGMARKTVLKLLLQRYAPMSIEMEKAEIADQSIIKDATTLDVDYIDNSTATIDKSEERLSLMIGDCTTVAELIALQKEVEKFPDLSDTYELKFAELSEAEM